MNTPSIEKWCLDTNKSVDLIQLLGGTKATARMFNIQPPSVVAWKYNGIPGRRLKTLREIARGKEGVARDALLAVGIDPWGPFKNCLSGAARSK